MKFILNITKSKKIPYPKMCVAFSVSLALHVDHVLIRKTQIQLKLGHDLNLKFEKYYDNSILI